MSVDRLLAFLVIGLGALAAVAGLAAWRFPQRQELARSVSSLGLLALGASVAAWIARWRAAGHLPLFGSWESALSLAAFALAVPLVAPKRIRGALWPVAGLAAAALLAHGLLFDPTAHALTISERSVVVEAHAVIAWAAFAALLANAGLALARLLRRPDAGEMDGPLSASLSWGFVLHSAMIASGSVYSFLLFGRAWGFDPVESLALVVWLAYAALLHVHLFAGWEGRRLARWCLGIFVLLVVSYRCIVYFPPASTYHIFDMDRRLHLTGDENRGAR